MVDANNGWGISTGSIWRTTDGGTDWRCVTPPAAAGTAGAAEFLNASTAWVTFSREGGRTVDVFRTTDGGRSWQNTGVRPAGQGVFAVSLQFLNTKRGWLLASCGAAAGSEAVEVYRTDDGGVTWSRVATSNPEAQKPDGLPFSGDKSGLRFADRENGWLTGDSPADGVYLFRTRDGGRTWHFQALSILPGLSAEGGSAGSHPVIFFGSKEGLLPVVFYVKEPALVFYGTKNGGETWKAGTPLWPSSTDFSFCWSVIDRNHIIASDGHRIYATSDGSRTWTVVNTDVDFKDLGEMDFVSTKLGWAVINGKLWRTSDGGRHWSSQP